MYNIFVEIPKNFSDEDVVLEIQKGNNEFIPVLVGEYIGIIHKKSNEFTAAGYDREDFVQEGIIALYRAAMNYDFSSASFSTFATTCIENAVKTVAKRNVRKGNIPENLLSSLDDVDVPSSVSLENQVIEKETVLALFSEIKSVLSDFEYNVFTAYLTYYDYGIISEKLNVSVKSVNNALCRIRSKLKKKLAGNR